MKTREKNNLLNEIIELRKTLKEKEILLESAMLEDGMNVSTAKGYASIIAESKTFRFDTTRFKEDKPEEYNNYLKESTTRAHITIKAK